jgi:glycopeptide antibiotics resistance protein
MRRPRPRAAALLALYVIVLAALTLGSSPGEFFRWIANTVQPFLGLDLVTSVDVERTLNIAVFVPAGYLLRLLLTRTPPWVVWGSCVLASLAVEAVQFFLPGREPSVVDVLTNATGAALGVLLYAVVAGRAREPSAERR